MPYAANGTISTDAIEGGIEISDQQYAEAIGALMDGRTVSIENGFEIVDVPPPAEPEMPEEPELTLVEWQAILTANIDADAETSRLRYITGGSGQAMTYQQKAQEAAEVLALIGSGDIDAGAYPLLASEIGITAPTLIEVATVVNNAYQSWRLVGARIEALRLGGKAAVASAITIEAAKEAASIVWP